jgi:protein TonB
MKTLRLYLPAAGCAVLLHAIIMVCAQGFWGLPAAPESGREAGPDLTLSLRLIAAEDNPWAADAATRDAAAAALRAAEPAPMTHDTPAPESTRVIPDTPQAEYARAAPVKTAAARVRALAEHYSSMITVGGPYQKPRPLAEINPVYPIGARLRREQGVVVYRVFVSATGRIERIERERTSGSPELDEAARAALLYTGFSPALLRGKPIAGQVLIGIKFELGK